MTASDEIAIRVDGLGKLYQLARVSGGQRTLTEALRSALSAPLNRLRELQGTSETTDAFWALRNVSFDVRRGEVIGIVGRNGAGKSTLLKILSRIVEPTEGSATMSGRVASLLEVGTGFHPELSGRENVYLNGSILGMRKREIDLRFDDIVQFAEIERFLDTPVKRYSSGMYVRLAFAVAAHLEPEILIVDEVLAVGDAEFQKRCLGKMQEIAKGGGRTVVFVSHNMAAVRSLCTRGVLLQKGTVAMTDTAVAVVDEYLSPASSQPSATIAFESPRGARIWMMDATVLADGLPSTTVPMGSTLTLSVRFDTETPVRHPRFGFVIQTATGERLLNSNNRFQPSESYETPMQTGVIVCDLGMPPLMPGRYTISLWLGDMGQDHHIELDAVAFDVTERDLWGNGQIPPAATPLWWPTKFSLQ